MVPSTWGPTSTDEHRKRRQRHVPTQTRLRDRRIPGQRTDPNTHRSSPTLQHPDSHTNPGQSRHRVRSTRITTHTDFYPDTDTPPTTVPDATQIHVNLKTLPETVPQVDTTHTLRQVDTDTSPDLDTYSNTWSHHHSTYAPTRTRTPYRSRRRHRGMH